MNALDVGLRIVHILAAITLVGGIFFQCAVLMPACRHFAGDDARKLAAELRGRWSKLVLASTLVLLASGFVNYLAVVRLAKAGTITLARFYHPVIGVKMILALAVFFIASLLAGRSPAADRFRQRAPLWLTISSLVSIAIVSLAGILKVAGKLP